ncbi:hypothetical protein ACOKW7_10475, partial [Limnospira platensis CENA597]|uniref:hypothetical protein n=1 Tax=Limnospira platensis TaxID=118562 RepID=UPI003DA0CDF1
MLSPTLWEVRPIAYPFRSAIAQRARQKYRVASECDISPTFSEVRSPIASEVRSRSLGVRPIAYSLGSATYRL